jgi:hypothetical protein
MSNNYLKGKLRTKAPNSRDAKTIYPFPKSSHVKLNLLAGYKLNGKTGTFYQMDGNQNHLLAMYDGVVAKNVARQESDGSNSTKSISVLLNEPLIYTSDNKTKVNIDQVVYTAFDKNGNVVDIDPPQNFDLSGVTAGNIIGEVNANVAYVRVTLGPRSQLGGGGPYSDEISTYVGLFGEKVDGTQVPNPTSGGTSGADPGQIATAAAFSSYFTLPSILEMKEAILLTGQRSLLNDKPLLPFVEQIAAGSLREFMSLPNGDFYAFYPDYFGGLGKTAYWVIKDIEIIDGKIDLSDDELVTHMYVVGDTMGSESGIGYGTVDYIDRINTAGVINVFNAFMADFVNGPSTSASESGMGSAKPSLQKKEDAIKFLQKYGARPLTEEVAAIRSPIYETFLAYQRFCYMWAKQFKTTFEFTFMPELYPGGIVEFEEHGLQCYIERVVHNGSYESGFTTTAELTAPSATRDDSGNPHNPDKSWVHAGMIRSWDNPTSDEVGSPKGAY